MTGGAGNDTLRGNSGNDRLNGSDGTDILFGGKGDDRFFGGQGDDILAGHGGADEFFFDAFEDDAGKDFITDFNIGTDGVVLDDFEERPDMMTFDTYLGGARVTLTETGLEIVFFGLTARQIETNLDEIFTFY